jgi:hypothetical protein
MVVLISVKYLSFLLDDRIFFCTFGFSHFSCTSYIKLVYCSCRMVVLLSVKYFNFLVDNKIILFFPHWFLVGFLVLPILSGLTARAKR